MPEQYLKQCLHHFRNIYVCPVTSSHRMMIISQKHTKKHSLSHSLRPPLPNLNNLCCCWPFLYTLHSASQKQTCHCRHCCSSLNMKILWEHWRDPSLVSGSVFLCAHMWQGNRMECPHSKAYQSSISNNRLCNVFIAKGSFLSHGQELEDILSNTYVCVYREEGRRWQDEDQRQMFQSIHTFVCVC